MKGRARMLLVSGLAGALVGLMGAWLYMRMVRSDGRSGQSGPAELIRLGLSIVRVLRQIVALSRAVTA